MAIFNFSDYDDEKKRRKKPSQIAREEQKKKQSGNFDFSDYESVVEKRRKAAKPITVETKPKEPEKESLVQKATKKLKDLFAKKKDTQVEIIKAQKIEQDDTRDDTRDILEGLDVDLDTKETTSAQLSEAGEYRYSDQGQRDIFKSNQEKIQAAVRPLEEGYEEPGLFGSAVEAVKESTVSMVAGLGATSDMIGQMTGNMLLTEAGQKINTEAQKVLASNPEWSADPEEPWNAKKVTRLVSGAAPSLLGAIGATMVAGPGGAFAYGFSLEGGSTYQEAKAAGTEEEKAQLYGITVGTVNGILETIFPAHLLKKIEKQAVKKISQSLAKDVIKKAGKFGAKFTINGALEGTEEVVQQLWSNVIATNYDENRKWWDGLLESYVGGFGSGGIAGVVVKPGEYTPQELEEIIKDEEMLDTQEGKELLDSIEEAKKTDKKITVDEGGARVTEDVVEEPTKREVIKLDTKPEGVESAVATIKPDGTAGMAVVISEEAQGKGVGTKVVAELEQKLIDKGITQAEISAFEESVGFWEKQGYTKVEGAEVKAGAIKMEKTLKPVTETKDVPGGLGDIVEAKVSKELQPIAKTVSEYSSVEDFRQALKKGIELKDESLPNDLQEARRAIDNARRSGSVSDIKNANEKAQNIITKLNEVAQTSSPFSYYLKDNGKVEVSGLNASEITTGIYEPTILGKKISKIKTKDIPSMISELKEKSTLPNKSMGEIIANEQIRILEEIKSGATPVQDFYNLLSPSQVVVKKKPAKKVTKKPAKKPGLILKPSEASTTDEVMAEVRQLGLPPEVFKVNKKGEAVYKRPYIGKTELKTLIKNSPEFAANPVLTVVKDEKLGKALVFKGEKISFKMGLNSLQFSYEGNIKVGDKILVDETTLKGKQQQLRVVTSGGGVYGDAGGYSDVQSLTKTMENIKAIEMPELVRLARQTLGKDVALTRFKKYLGAFYHYGEIKLDKKIFKDPQLVAKVMAHELGHMTDWMDTKNLSRGNLIGRMASLNSFTKKTFSSMANLDKINALEDKRVGLTAERRGHKPGTTESKMILKQIKSLNKQIKAIESKATLTDKELREELKALTQLWKPFNEAKSPEGYIKYRYSSVELYADAISVLFNDPDLLQEKAPLFWKGFFDNIDKKPIAKKNLFEIWDMLNATGYEKQDLRSQEVREMFDKGEDKIQAIVKEKRNREKDYVFQLKHELFDKNQRLIDKVEKLKKEGTPVPDDLNPVYMLEESNYVGGLVKAWVEENIDPLYKEMKQNDLAWEDLGEVLFHERVVNERGAVHSPLTHIKKNAPDTYSKLKPYIPGGMQNRPFAAQMAWLTKNSSVDTLGEETVNLEKLSAFVEAKAFVPVGIANPLGFDNKTSQEQLDHLKTQHGDKWGVIQGVLKKYRTAMDEITAKAEEAEFYSPDLIKQMKSNPAYATFQVLDYLDLNISSKVSQQVGTLKEIANPASSTVVKAISTIQAIERNETKKSIVDFMKTNFSEEILPAKTIFTGRSQIPIPPKDSDFALFTVIEKGKLKGYYVDKYIASTMDNMSTGQANAVVRVIKFFNSKLFRPMFITFNLGFQSFNLVRDFTRFYKNTPNLSMLGAVKGYGKSLKPAFKRAWNIPDATIREMEKSKILGITYNDVIAGLSAEDKQIDLIIAKAGLSPLKGKKKNILVRPFQSVFDAIEKSGNFIETIPKVAGYKQLNGKMPPKKLGQFIRTSVGSPDFLRRGAGYGWYNEVFLFANAIKEGIRSDYNVAFKDPTTRAGYWWKTGLVTLLPKTLMFAALAGFMGDELKKMFENVSEYDMTNYTILPLTLDDGKTVYVRIPQDETGRLIGGLFWKGLNIATDGRAELKDIQDVASYAGGQAPGLSPILTSIMAATQFAAGKNPYDSFRGRNVIPDTEFEAGGKYALKPYLTWQFNQLGGGVFWKTYYSTQPASSKTWLQKTLEAPILSNVIGRWLKVSDYGQKEKNEKMIEGVEKDTAKRRLQEREKVNLAIEEYRQGDPTEANRSKFRKSLIDDIVGTDPRKFSTTEKTKATNLKKKFNIGIVKGQQGSLVDSLIYANTNEEKIVLLSGSRNSMEPDEFSDLMNSLLDQGIVSENVAKEVKKTEQENLKTSFKIDADMFKLDNPFKADTAKASELSAIDRVKNALMGGKKVGMYSENYDESVIYPYDIRGSDKEGMVKFYYPSGSYSEIKKEDVPKYGALMQLEWDQWGLGEYPEYAPDYLSIYKLEDRYYKDKGKKPPPKRVTKKSKNATPTPFDKAIKESFGDKWDEATRVLRYEDEFGGIHGENINFGTGAELDVVNRIDPKTGKYSPDAPAKQVENYFTGKSEDSIDRGLFRINNQRFYDILHDSRPGYRDAMYKAGIIDSKHEGGKGLTGKKAAEYWDKMHDPELNTKMAKIIYNKGGWCGWFGAPAEYVKHCDWYENIRGNK